MSRSRILFLVLSGALLVPLVAGRVVAREEDDDSLFKYLSVFTDVLNLVRQVYVEDVSYDALMSAALAGTTDALDPWATFVPADSAQAYAAVRGIGDRQSGLTLVKDRGIAYAVAVVPGGPAATAGVETGDIVSAIGGRPTRTLALWEIQNLFTGEPGTSVELEIRRRGKLETASVILGSFADPLPELEEHDGMAVITLHRFGADTPAALRGLLDTAEQSGLGGLLLDLREAHGADPEVGYRVAELFARGELGQLAGRSGSLRSFRSGTEPVFAGPIVALVDQSTLGPAEVLAAVLQQSAGASLVGGVTFGHAGREALLPLSDGSSVVLTDAFYTGPDGVKLDRGIEPDVLVDASARTFSEKDVPQSEIVFRRGLETLQSFLRKAA